MSVDTSSLSVSSRGSINGSSCGLADCRRIDPKLRGCSSNVVMYIPRSASPTRLYNASHTSTHHRPPLDTQLLKCYRLSRGYNNSLTSLPLPLFGCCSVQLQQLLFDYDSTKIRRPFDCLSKVLKVTVT